MFHQHTILKHIRAQSERLGSREIAFCLAETVVDEIYKCTKGKP